MRVPNNFVCAFHFTGNTFINFDKVSSEGWRPSTIISTISGASNVMRRIRLT